jgi:hypothetical protein
MSLINWSRAALLAALPMAAVAAPTQTAESSSQTPYVVPARQNVLTRSILTVGDAVSFKPGTQTPYRMAGIPDGLGAYDNGNGTFTLLMNHELPAAAGIPRDHGFAGSFISRWIIDAQTLTALQGEDLMRAVFRWDTPTASYQPLNAPLSRFCSGDLAESAFYNPATGRGYNGRIYLCGEENGSIGRAFAHFLTGRSYELPALGKFSWENAVANAATGDRTVIAGTEDSAGGQVYIYVGNKTLPSASADPAARVAEAGLSGGTLFAIKVPGVALENDATVFTSGSFSAANLGNVTALSGGQLKAAALSAQATGFNRPEDASWDPSNPRDLYFVTTASFPNPAVPGSGKSRLWRLRFHDPANPAAGGVASVLIDGTDPNGPKMMDNITVNKRGTVLIQEDVGNQLHLGKVWRYSVATGKLEIIAQHDPARFTPGQPRFLTADQESSGIIPMDDILGEGWYLLDVQAHYPAGDAELVEGGQLLGLHFAPGQEKK